VSQGYGKRAMDITIFIILLILLIGIFVGLIWILRKNRIRSEEEIAHLNARLKLLEEKSSN
ncbi:MAG: hypothetical protein ACE1Y4_13015, partial [Lysobacterales bacterium]